MMLYKNEMWLSDLDRVTEQFPIINDLAGRSILVTGATGLICSSVIDLLIRYNEMHKKQIEIYAAGRSEQNMKIRFGEYAAKDYFHFVLYNANDGKLDLREPVDYIIHGASNASPNKIVREPVETMESNFMGLLGLMRYTVEHLTSRILYISSSEIYGRKENNDPFREEDYGYVDLLNPRNSYPVGKRAAETLCASFFDEYGVDSVIVRPGHIYGPTALKTDNRVSSAWAYEAAAGRDITMKSDGAQIRSYVYCLDCASAILIVLLKGKPLNVYNISNPDSIISIREMAEMLAKSAGVHLQIEIPTEEERKGFNPMRNSSLDSSKLLSLGWKGLFDAEVGISHTVQILKS